MDEENSGRGSLGEGDLLDLYEGLYYSELEKKDSINNRTSTATGIIAGAVAATLFFVRNFPFGASHFVAWLFYTTFGIAAVSLVLASIRIGLAWMGREYFYVSDPRDIDEWRESQKEYHAQNPEETPGLEERLHASVLERFSQAAGESRDVNRKKSRHLYRGQAWTLSTLLFLTLSFFPFYVTIQSPDHRTPNQNKETEMVPDNGNGNGNGSGGEGANGGGNGGKETSEVTPKKEPFPDLDVHKEGAEPEKRDTSSDE